MSNEKMGSVLLGFAKKAEVKPEEEREECKKIEEDRKYVVNETVEQQTVLNSIQNRELRKSYSNKVFWFMCVWASLMFLTLWLGNLSDIVLITLTGSTTVSVIGLVGFVVNGLFKPAKDKDN